KIRCLLPLRDWQRICSKDLGNLASFLGTIAQPWLQIKAGSVLLLGSRALSFARLTFVYLTVKTATRRLPGLQKFLSHYLSPKSQVPRFISYKRRAKTSLLTRLTAVYTRRI